MRDTAFSENNSYIHPEAQIAAGVLIGPFCLIEQGVHIEEGCRIASHVILRKGTHLKKNVSVDSFSIIGGEPQYRNFDSTIQSGVVVEAGTIIRENVTIHRGIAEGSLTQIGKDCLLMTTAHVAHDCILGDHVTLTNGVLLAGHVILGNYANMGGGAVVHQFVRIGESAMIAGHATITQDIPPYLMVAERNEVAGFNLIGLKRRLFSTSTISILKKAYRFIYNNEGPWKDRAEKALKEFSSEEKEKYPEVITFLEFFKEGKRGQFAQSKV